MAEPQLHSDFNFDFTTYNSLIYSELIYKAYKAGGGLPLQPEVINDRRLLPSNRLAEQVVAKMGPAGAFSFLCCFSMPWKSLERIQGSSIGMIFKIS